MHCYNHPTPAVGICNSCAKGICADCAVDSNEHALTCHNPVCIEVAEVTRNIIMTNAKVFKKVDKDSSLAGIFNIICGLFFITFGIIFWIEYDGTLLSIAFMGLGLAFSIYGLVSTFRRFSKIINLKKNH